MLLGVDLATAGARVIALDGADGTVLAQRAAALPAPHRPGAGASEQEARYAEVVQRADRWCGGRSGRCRGAGGGAVRHRNVRHRGAVRQRRPAGRGGGALRRPARPGSQQDRLRSAGAPSATTSALARIGWLAAGSTVRALPEHAGRRHRCVGRYPAGHRHLARTEVRHRPGGPDLAHRAARPARHRSARRSPNWCARAPSSGRSTIAQRIGWGSPGGSGSLPE